MPQILGFAVIGADGTTLHASGVNNVEHLGAGLYHITFDFSVANACEIASIGHWQTPGFISAYGVPDVGPNVVEVATFIDLGGNLPGSGDLTFQLLVVA